MVSPTAVEYRKAAVFGQACWDFWPLQWCFGAGRPQCQLHSVAICLLNAISSKPNEVSSQHVYSRKPDAAELDECGEHQCTARFGLTQEVWVLCQPWLRVEWLHGRGVLKHELASDYLVDCAKSTHRTFARCVSVPYSPIFLAYVLLATHNC